MLEHGGYGVVVVGCKRCCSFENCCAACKQKRGGGEKKKSFRTYLEDTISRRNI